MYAGRIVVPASLQTEVLKMLHCGHPGMKRMKSLARQHVYWPGIDQQIEEVVRKCETCATEAKAPKKTELHSWPKAKGPWKRMPFIFKYRGEDCQLSTMVFQNLLELIELYKKAAGTGTLSLGWPSTRVGGEAEGPPAEVPDP
ncbi:hypothetical protein niasHT_013292 [Heterodera trifolii]|uniref:RNA-directed DNA polymerase n=1 Tax=Heterodera trifolii TaxID=157864 RepID=A0ABD2LAW6_9BILA